MKKDGWDTIITSNHNFFNLNFSEILKYWDLIMMLVKRDFVTFYKQTILGPLWYIIQPVITSIVFTFVFGRLANIPTDGTPQFIFYMCGIVAWNYFAACLNSTSNTFILNSTIFSKVYFPRAVVPISNVILCTFQFLIQFLIFIFFYIYYFYLGANVTINVYILILPIVVLQISLLGLGIGMLISSLTTKYRDLTFVMTFGVQLWMFATPVVYPLSVIPSEYQFLASLNPMTPIIESFKYLILGNSIVSIYQILTGVLMTLIILFLGYFMFNKMEKNFIDTV